MTTIRLVRGEIFFDDFDTTTLNERWDVVVPNDFLRYSLTEQPGFIKLFHRDPNFMILTDEPESYVLDMRNEYVVQNGINMAGIIVLREYDNSLEILEYYDLEKDQSFVYQFIRIVKQGDIYTFYGKNIESSEWEMVASVNYQSAGKVGLIVKGPAVAGSPDFQVDYVKIYKGHSIQLVNVPLNYRVSLFRENHTAISHRISIDPYNGVRFQVEDIPYIKAYFQVYNEIGELIHTSGLFDMCGGDVYYYGATLDVKVNGLAMSPDSDHFLGYYQNAKIDFTIEIINSHDVAYDEVSIFPMPYEDDVLSHTWVRFDINQEGTFTETFLNLGVVPANSSVIVYGRVIRDTSVDPSDITPFRFNLRVSNK